MRNGGRLLLLALVISVASSAGASDFGFIDVERAVGTVDQGAEAIRKLNEWAEPRQQFLDALLVEASHFRKQIEQQSAAASPDAIQALQDKLRDKGREYEDSQRRFTRDFEAKQQELLRGVGRRLDELVTEYAEQKKLDAVFAMKDMPIVFVSDAADITEELIAIYNSRYPLESN